MVLQNLPGTWAWKKNQSCLQGWQALFVAQNRSPKATSSYIAGKNWKFWGSDGVRCILQVPRKDVNFHLDFAAMVDVEHRHLGTTTGNMLHSFCGYLPQEITSNNPRQAGMWMPQISKIMGWYVSLHFRYCYVWTWAVCEALVLTKKNMRL